MPKRKKRLKRGYPVAILIGIEERQAHIWQIFSEVVKPLNTIKLGNRKNKSKKQISEFHETIIDAIRSFMQEGIRSILISSPIKTDYAEIFLEHVKKHHAWLVQQKSQNVASFGVLIGHASTPSEVRELVQTEQYLNIIGDTTSREADKIIDVLEKRLNTEISEEKFLFSLKEIEDLIYSRWEPEDLKPEYLLLTDKYLANSKQKNRLNKLQQIARNRQIKVKIMSEEETNAGKRVASFGGIVCFTENPLEKDEIKKRRKEKGG